ncbi:MAG: DUF4331 domain-containing protein [bacterium]
MKTTRRTLRNGILFSMCMLALSPLASRAGGHGDAPLVKQDPQVDITGVYAFVGTRYDDPARKVLTVIASVRPLSEPGDGVVYERFADDALYSIHIAHPISGHTLMRYDFAFSDANPLSPPGLKNPNTALSYGVGTEIGPILAVGDARQNYTQTYTVTRVAQKTSTVIGSDLLTPPPNVGLRTTPLYNDPASGQAVSGAVAFTDLDTYTRTTVHSLPDGEAVFAGSREDGFFADMPGISDLLDPRIIDNNGNTGDGFGQDGNGVDGFKGYNVLVYAIQIPVDSLPSKPYTAVFADLATPLPATGLATGVGVYASVSRPRATVRPRGEDPVSFGSWITVSRMGNPLFNELLVPLSGKDDYNRSSPRDDSALAVYAENPEIAALINLLLGTDFVTAGRTDLAALYIPDLIRVDTTTPPVRLAGQIGFSRLGFLGGDTATDGAGRVKSSGWPNGRRLGDDVVDIALTALASGPAYSSVTLFGDNVAANDQVFHQVFPYAATPHAGPVNRKDP